MSWPALDAIQYSIFGHYNNFLFIYILQQSALILLQLNFILWNEINTLSKFFEETALHFIDNSIDLHFYSFSVDFKIPYTCK